MHAWSNGKAQGLWDGGGGRGPWGLRGRNLILVLRVVPGFI